MLYMQILITQNLTIKDHRFCPAMHCPVSSSISHSVEWRSPPSRCSSLVCNSLNSTARSMLAPSTPAAAAHASLQPMHVSHCVHLGQQVLKPVQLSGCPTGRRSVITPAAAAQPQQEAVVVAIPNSKEEAVSAAASALAGQVKGLGKKARAKKGFGGSGGGAASTRFSVELPLPSASPADSAALLGDLLRQLPAAAVAEPVVVCASEQTAAAAAAAGGVLPSVRGLKVLSLQAACRADSLTGPLLLVEPTVADVALVNQLLSEVWSGPWAVVVNPTWFTEGGVPQQYKALLDSWEAAYSLTITATQGLMRTEGAVLRVLAPGSSSSSPWRVLLKDRRSDQFMQVGQMQRRPTASDLELAFINAKAAQSPLTSLVKGVRGIFDKQQQQQ